MQDCLSAEARDDADEEIAVGLKEIERARVSVEKGEVKELRRRDSGNMKSPSRPLLEKVKELNINRKKKIV